jgi:hypothetical protein
MPDMLENGRRTCGDRQISRRKEVSNMARVSVILLALFVALSFVAVGFAADTGTTMGTQDNAGHHEMTYTGQVVSVDPTGSSIVVNGKEGERTFDVSKAATAGKIQAQQNVSVQYTETDGRMIASVVKVVQPRVSRNDWYNNYGYGYGY